MIKFNHKLSDLGAIVGVDLAQYHTGVTVYSKGQFTHFIPINVKNTDEAKEHSLFMQFTNLFQALLIEYARNGEKIMVVQERQPLQNGKNSTAQTICALARAHAILHLAVQFFEKDGVEFYDENGIHSTSVKALFKTKECPKPQKGDIRKELVKLYQLDDTKLTDDISDAIAVVHTLINKKWNQDIDEKIREIKKEIKKLKAPHAIAAHQAEIERIQSLKL